jgi:hypothetical protein
VLGTLKAEADTKVSVTERLVDFSVFHVTDSNFPTLDKTQVQEIVAEVVKSIPQVQRVIALDRVLAGIDKSQIIPKNTGDLKADPPPFSSAHARGDAEYRRRTDMEPRLPDEPAVRHQHQLGPVQAEHDGHVVSPQRDVWLKAPALQGPWTAAGHAAGRLQRSPRERELASGENKSSRRPHPGGKGANGLRQPAAGRADPAARRPDVPACHRHRPELGE